MDTCLSHRDPKMVRAGLQDSATLLPVPGPRAGSLIIPTLPPYSQQERAVGNGHSTRPESLTYFFLFTLSGEKFTNPQLMPQNVVFTDKVVMEPGKAQFSVTRGPVDVWVISGHRNHNR